MVYLQTNIRSRALESALELQMPSVDVIVVGRFRDFARGLAERPDEKAARALAEAWRPHRGAVAILTWHCYNNPAL